MGIRSEEGADRFFDANEEIASVSDSNSDCSENASWRCQEVGSVLSSSDYYFWMKRPQSVNERRDEFIRRMDFSLDRFLPAGEVLEDAVDNMEVGGERSMEISGAMLRTSDIEDGNLGTQTSISCRQNDEAHEAVDDDEVGENLTCRIKSLDDGREFIMDEVGHDGILRRLREVGSNRLLTIEEFQSVLGSSNLVQQFMRRGLEEVNSFVDAKRKKRKENWLEKLRVKASMASIKERINAEFHDHLPIAGSGNDRVHVNPHKKRLKELSCLYREQDFCAHKGSILAMKFSPDGQYLASGGEDEVVRVWKVTEHERSAEVDISRFDPSCLYFTAKGVPNLTSLNKVKEKGDMMKKLRKSSDAACIVIPRRVFQITENPLHEFYGHEGEVLDISWSQNGFLLSSSIDKTVRLWRVGCDQCLRVFPHNDYVTCVQFNPVDDNYFISGSIDGKVRIWKILSCHVVHWINIKEIVTAICYRPDGKGGIVGSMAGNCHFYEVTDNCLRLDAVVSLQRKKKLTRKRICSFEFSPSDPSKVMVTSADSQIRILDGVDVICKFRGLKNGGNQIFASFTWDGKHIVSAREDSNVYIWDCSDNERKLFCRTKNIRSSESFQSQNALIALPWPGIRSVSESLHQPRGAQHSEVAHGGNDETSDQTDPSLSKDCFTLGQMLPSASLPKGSATWPEKTILDLSPTVVLPAVTEIDSKFFKNVCQNTVNCHLWGLVIVTAGWDGRIRAYHNYGLPVRA
ncbi:hypothetical protein Ancab_032882 [Ancistrocladus abbreviatus]